LRGEARSSRGGRKGLVDRGGRPLFEFALQIGSFFELFVHYPLFILVLFQLFFLPIFFLLRFNPRKGGSAAWWKTSSGQAGCVICSESYEDEVRFLFLLLLFLLLGLSGSGMGVAY
jgi:hypothetical protein